MRAILLTVILLIGAIPIFAKDPDATVVMTKLIEKRELFLKKGDFSGWENGIELTIHVDGPAVVGARQYGQLKVSKAIDDAGTDLTTKAEGAPDRNEEAFQEIREPMAFGRNGDAPKPTGFDVDLKLPSPSARKAKAIKELTGQLSVLVGGTKTIVETKNLNSSAGQTVDHAALKELGVTFKIVGSQTGGMMQQMLAGDAKKNVSAEISGNLPALADVRITCKGEKINNGASWNDENGVRKITYSCDADIPADAVLELEVWPGQRTITVPFAFKNVKLP